MDLLGDKKPGGAEGSTRPAKVAPYGAQDAASVAKPLIPGDPPSADLEIAVFLVPRVSGKAMSIFLKTRAQGSKGELGYRGSIDVEWVAVPKDPWRPSAFKGTSDGEYSG